MSRMSNTALYICELYEKDLTADEIAKQIMFSESEVVSAINEYYCQLFE